MPPETPDKILREPAVLDAMGFGHSKLWDDVSKGLFPRPVRIGLRAVGWFASEVAAVQARLRAERDAKA